MTVRYIARPTSMFRFRFDLSRDDEAAGLVEHRLWGRPGVVELDGATYSLERTGMRSLRLTGGPLTVDAAPVGSLRNSYRIDWPGGSVLAVRRGIGYGMRFVTDGGEEVGRMGLRNQFTRTLVADVPDTVPGEVVALAMFLAIRMRRRAVTAGGGA